MVFSNLAGDVFLLIYFSCMKKILINPIFIKTNGLHIAVDTN